MNHDDDKSSDRPPSSRSRGDYGAAGPASSRSRGDYGAGGPPSPDWATSWPVIRIEELEVFARVGVPEAERASAQRLIFNLTFWLARQTHELEDEIARTVDYAAVCAETKRFVQARSDRLIETLADALANHLLESFAIRKITIELRKFILPEVKFVSVTVTRERATE